MNEWKELVISDLPPDILTQDYEWEIEQGSGWEEATATDEAEFRIKALHNLLFHSGDNYRYRKPEPKAPSHEEIMTLWWLENNGMWKKVSSYPAESEHLVRAGFVYKMALTWREKDWFTGRQSATIPPESV